MQRPSGDVAAMTEPIGTTPRKTLTPRQRLALLEEYSHKCALCGLPIEPTESWREVGYRKRVYARLVEAGKMKAENAARGIAIMEAIMADYNGAAEAEAAKGRLL
jgi:hypothetical protein